MAVSPMYPFSVNNFVDDAFAGNDARREESLPLKEPALQPAAGDTAWRNWPSTKVPI